MLSLPACEPSGYSHPLYAQSFSGLGPALELPLSGGWLVGRNIPGSTLRDAMGPYPIFCCRDWRALEQDLAALPNLVSVSLVTDPFGDFDPDLLRKCFPDVALPFKDHFVTDLARRPEEFLSQHHARNAAKALAAVSVELCPEPLLHAADWIRLYAHLVKKRSVVGRADFPAETLRLQLQVPGLEMMRATSAGETIGMVLWMIHGGVAYYHLGAYDETGYRMGASFAIFRTAIDIFARRGLRWLSLGAGPGSGGCGGGLTRFKRGWSTGTRPAWFCGRVFDREAYRLLSHSAPAGPEGWFPAYRKGDLP